MFSGWHSLIVQRKADLTLHLIEHKGILISLESDRSIVLVFVRGSKYSPVENFKMREIARTMGLTGVEGIDD